MDHTLNLSDLYELLYDTLLITEEAKKVLKRDCDEATFVLKPWKVKTAVEKQVDENICNCKKIANVNEAEEIAAGIDRAIILAQQLREKLELNVAPKRKLSRKDTVEDIYLSNLTSVSNRKKVSRNNVTTHKVNTAKSPDCKRSTTLRNDKVTSVTTKEPTLPKLVGKTTKRSETIDKLQSKMSTKVVGKKKEKNFILENKLNVKRISSINKLQVDGNNDTPQNSRKSLSPKASAAELSELIDKMTRRSTENTLISPKNSADCPLHGDNACQLIQEQIVTIDVVEALRHFNVPNEIVKVLRMYHTFLKTETDNLQHDIRDVTKEGKHRKSVNVFLKECEAMNTATHNCLLQESRLFKVAEESISAFGNTFSEELNLTQLDDMKDTLAQLTASLKQYNIENVIKPVISKPSCDLSLARGWISNGIWNISSMGYFQNFSKMYNIQYRNRRQLLSLYEAIQKLQYTEYLNTLIQIILRDIIPTVKSNVNPTSAEYARTYKMIFILHQGLNPEVPVLVRTDN